MIDTQVRSEIDIEDESFRSLNASIRKIREAVTFLKIVRMKVSPTDAEYVEIIDKNLAILGGDSK